MMAQPGLEIHRTQSAVIDAIQSLIDSAEGSLTIAVPKLSLSEFVPQLSAAIKRDVLVLLLVHGDETGPTPAYEDIATAVRTIESGITPLLVTADTQRGLTGHSDMLTDSIADYQATEFDNRNLAHDEFTMFLGSHWLMGTERYVADVCAFPRTFSAFQFAVLMAALALRAGTPITARARVLSTPDRTETTISGPVINARQSLVYPASSKNPAERSLTIETDDGPVTVGGSGATKEAYECREITLDRADDQ
ncbi:TrmB family transcriptional regulator sugar-binding domain-containing protein [Haloarcula sp. H-GB4]|uniref:TrmB family transcriptional regulator sugar-binding domain-containing protein n=1 Tax=Haloarcula sp. H-GB4 TaxID=3069755 RepID=UPI0027B1BA58|nr:TrmB family transcriptional regulator sugar-binding domain-containing protein [Haloarcula sp. H-GB4]MDQ2072092.1 TrmB family transcriptional regulator sugar-binding domain-containing protein [Haloarcula sp. H-GB4]